MGNWTLTEAARKKEIKTQIMRKVANAFTAFESDYFKSAEVHWTPGENFMMIVVKDAERPTVYLEVRVKESQ